MRRAGVYRRASVCVESSALCSTRSATNGPRRHRPATGTSPRRLFRRLRKWKAGTFTFGCTITVAADTDEQTNISVDGLIVPKNAECRRMRKRTTCRSSRRDEICRRLRESEQARKRRRVRLHLPGAPRFSDDSLPILLPDGKTKACRCKTTAALPHEAPLGSPGRAPRRVERKLGSSKGEPPHQARASRFFSPLPFPRCS